MDANAEDSARHTPGRVRLSPSAPTHPRVSKQTILQAATVNRWSSSDLTQSLTVNGKTEFRSQEVPAWGSQ